MRLTILLLAAMASLTAGEVTEISQYGITWTFAKPVQAGRYVTGDWWVVGPVQVVGVSPAPAPGRNGSVVDPAAGRQGYDDRTACFDAKVRAAYPLDLKPGQSLVSSASLDKVGDMPTDTVPGCTNRTPLRTAVVLTCESEAPPADAFRPAYVGHEEVDPATWKTFGKGANDGAKAESYRDVNGPAWVGQALAARLMGAIPVWNHQPYFDYVDRWVREQPEKTGTALCGAMWKTYREQADRIGEDVAKRRASPPPARTTP